MEEYTAILVDKYKYSRVEPLIVFSRVFANDCFFKKRFFLDFLRHWGKKFYKIKKYKSHKLSVSLEDH